MPCDPPIPGQIDPNIEAEQDLAITFLLGPYILQYVMPCYNNGLCRPIKHLHPKTPEAMTLNPQPEDTAIYGSDIAESIPVQPLCCCIGNDPPNLACSIEAFISFNQNDSDASASSALVNVSNPNYSSCKSAPFKSHLDMNSNSLPQNLNPESCVPFSCQRTLQVPGAKKVWPVPVHGLSR